MKITKYIASAMLMLTAAASFTVNAAETEDVTTYEYVVIDGKAIITNVSTSEKSFDVPYAIEDGDSTYEVIGIKDWAFALCENLEIVNVPDSLTIANTGNVAFLTSSAVMDFMDNELSDTATTDDVLKYIAQKADYKNGNFTDADLAELSVKLNNKLEMIDLSVANTVEGKVMTLLKNVDQMNLSPELQNKFNIWIATITYDGLTLCGNENSEMHEYAIGREFLGMKFKSSSELLHGDANGDGKFNVRDAAYVASSVAAGKQLEVNIATDYNQDGKVNVRDAAAMARALSGSN